MKKIYLPLLIAFLSTNWLGAQEPGESIAQPVNFVGRKLNAAGEVTKEYGASFSYDVDGKLQYFGFSEWGVTSDYTYEDGFLTRILTQHDGQWPHYSDALCYTYENGRVKTESHTWDAMNSDESFEYFYQDDGRLYRKNYAGSNLENFWGYSLYEYDTKDKTSTESYYVRGSTKGDSFIWYLKRRTTCQFDESYNLLSKQSDGYNVYGDLTSSKKTLYTYNQNGKLNTEINQDLVENEWANKTIHIYIYDDKGRVSEQQEGAWSVSLDDWNIQTKTIHEYSLDDQTYTVSFFKKSGDDWIRDAYNYQRIFFEPELSMQQNALGCFVWETLMGSTLVNQFEFEMVYTKKPTYVSTMENDAALCQVYPNPGSDQVTIKAPVENSVIRFYDMQGRLLMAKPFDFSTTISTGDWSQGIYLWEIWNGTQKEASGKWVKE